MIKVLVVDDSAFMRKVLSEIINSAKDMEVCATARDGEDAIKKVAQHMPHVITMDIEMPGMDGVEATRQIMDQFPTPILVVSALTYEGSQYTLDAYEAGAVDMIVKPSGSISLDMKKLSNELIEKIRFLAQSKVQRRKAVIKPIKREFEGSIKEKVVVIASSTGGPQTLERLIPYLPKNTPSPILIVQHMPPVFTRSFAERLNKSSEVEVVEAKSGDELKEGVVYIAPGDFHMEIGHNKLGGKDRFIVTLNKEPKEEGVRPCANFLFRSAAKHFGKNVIGVVLTGMGADGTSGAKKIKEKGGTIIAQDEDTSIIYGMPKSVYEAGYVDIVLPLEKIPVEILNQLDK